MEQLDPYYQEKEKRCYKDLKCLWFVIKITAIALILFFAAKGAFGDIKTRSYKANVSAYCLCEKFDKTIFLCYSKEKPYKELYYGREKLQIQMCELWKIGNCKKMLALLSNSYKNRISKNNTKQMLNVRKNFLQNTQKEQTESGVEILLSSMCQSSICARQNKREDETQDRRLYLCLESWTSKSLLQSSKGTPFGGRTCHWSSSKEDRNSSSYQLFGGRQQTREPNVMQEYTGTSQNTQENAVFNQRISEAKESEPRIDNLYQRKSELQGHITYEANVSAYCPCT